MYHLLYLLFMRYMLNISDEEKQALLSQHQQPYNGYQTLRLQQPDNTIRVYDPAGDKNGVQVTANGNVRTYSNMNLREGKGEMCEQCKGGIMQEGKCSECGYEPGKPARLQDKFDYVAEGEMCEQCGSGTMNEGECNECGYTIKNPEPMYSQGFDYTNEEVSASLQQPYSEIDFGNYDFDSEGPLQFQKGKSDLDYSDDLQRQQDILDYTSKHDGTDRSKEMLQDLESHMNQEYSGKEKLKGEKKPYEFDSDGPMATSGVFREIEDPEEIEKVKESIKESINWFKRFSKYN